MRAPIPKFYANGLGVASTVSDVSVVFLQNGAPIASVAALPVVKSLIEDLTKSLQGIERRTGEKVQGVRELLAKYSVKP